MVVHVAQPGEVEDATGSKSDLRPAPSDRSQTDRPQLDQVKGVFLASLNHEIRTPLSGIMGMLDLLLETSIRSNSSRSNIPMMPLRGVRISWGCWTCCWKPVSTTTN